MNNRCLLYIFFFFFFLHEFIPSSVYAESPKGKSLKISDQSILRMLDELSSFGNRTTWEKQNLVAEYLFDKLKPYKNLEVFFHTYMAGGRQWKNVIARLPGKKDPKKVFIFCAHYDSHPTGLRSGGTAPGVDDNATGVSVLLEGVRIISETNSASTLEWVFFSNEEQGHLGSKAYAEDLKNKGRIIQGVINIDTIGYTHPSLITLWRETNRKGWFQKGMELGKQIVKTPLYYVQRGFKNPNELLLIGGRPAHKAFVDQIFSHLKEADFGIKKDLGPQCG